MKKVIIIGGGPAGMMAAIQSASCGCDVTIVEKNEKLLRCFRLLGVSFRP